MKKIYGSFYRAGFMILITFFVIFASSHVFAAEPKGEIILAWPHLDQAFDAINMKWYVSHSTFNFLYDGLLNMGYGKKDMALAKSYKISKDGLVIDFTLRKGVKFHNGDPFTANDVKFTLDTLMSDRADHAYKGSFKAKIKSIEVLDDYQVRFNLKEPWLEFFTSARVGMQPILPRNYYLKVGKEGFLKNPVGTGPYKLADLKLGEWNKYEANKDYWGQVSQVRYIIQKKIPEPLTRFSMLVKGEADLIAGLAGNLVEDIKKNKDLKLAFCQYTETDWLCLNRKAYPQFNDPKLRLAMSLAIDRKLIAEKLLPNAAEPSKSSFTPKTFGYDPSVPSYTYDPEKARQLIKEGGYEGFEFNYLMLTESLGAAPNTPQVLEAIAGYFEAVGLKPKRISTDYAGWMNEMRGGRFNGVAIGATSTPDDGGANMEAWFITRCVWGFCVPGVYDDLYQASAQAKTIKEREKILQQFNLKSHEDLGVIPLFWYSQIYGVGPKIKEWNPPPLSGYHLNLQTAKIAQ